MVNTHSTPLRAADLALRALIPLNWLYGAAVLLLLQGCAPAVVVGGAATALFH